jgi:hypothetical protein
MPDVRKYLNSDIDRALNHNFSFFGKSAAERLIEYTLLVNRQHFSDAIKQDMASDSSVDERNEKEQFLRAILKNSEQLFKFPVLTKRSGESTQDYKERLARFYAEKGYLDDLPKMRNLKTLISRTFNELGYESPEYELFGKKSSDINLLDQNALLEVLVKLSDDAENGYVYPFVYTDPDVVRPTTSLYSDFRKENTRVLKKLLYVVMFFVAAVIGIGEGFVPAKFYLAQLLGVGITMPVALAFAGFAFFAAFSVNTLLFRDDSYKTFKDLIFKNRFFKDAKGNKLSRLEIFRNVVAVGLALFSACTIAGLSFFFSGFGAIPAAFISLMTAIGFLGVLTYNLMNMLQPQSVVILFNYFKSLLWEPLANIFKNGFSFKALLQNSFTWMINVISVFAMIVFGVSVVAATSAMFMGALSGIPLLVGAIGSTGVAVMVGVAEIALGAFFIRNVSKFIDTVRVAALDLPNKIENFFTQLFSAKKAGVDTVYEEHPYRQAAVRTGRIAGVVLVSFAFINAGGFAVGYLMTASTHVAVVSVLGLGMFAPALLLLAAPIIAALSYTFSSVGGNAAAAVNAVSAPEPMHTYNYKLPVDSGLVDSGLNAEREPLLNGVKTLMTSRFFTVSTVNTVDANSTNTENHNSAAAVC